MTGLLSYAEWGRFEYWRPFLLSAADASLAEQSIAALVERFGALFSGRQILPVNYGRTALDVALRTFRSQRPDRDEVIIPSYVCPAVVEKINALGLTPIPVEIGDDLNLDADAVEDAVSPRTLAVVAVHMYANPAPIERLEALCGSREIFLIDDAAQVVGVTVGGRQLGTFGDAGLVSFSQSKTIVAGCENAGGLLIVNNKCLGAQMRDLWQSLPAGRFSLLDHLYFIFQYQFARYSESLAYRINEALEKSGVWTHPAPDIAPRKISGPSAALALRQLARLNTLLDGKRRVLEAYHRRLDESGAIRIPQYAHERYLSRVLLLLPEGTGAAMLRPLLANAGVQTRLGYPVYAHPSKGVPARAAALQPRLFEAPYRSTMSGSAINVTCDHVLAVVDSLARPSAHTRS
jgi:dTDP-4-amino-4,6-dideoxygalactose transaminase